MCHPEVPEGHQSPVVRREEITIPLSTGESLSALAAYPENDSGQAVVVIPDIFGRSPFYEDLTGRLATAGYRAILIDFFFRQGELPQRDIELAHARRRLLDENQVTRDSSDAIDWMKNQPGIVGKRIGTIGFCMGGTQVLILSAQRNDTAAVCFYGFPGKLPNATEKTATTPLTLVDTTNGPIRGFWGDQDAEVGMHNVEAYGAEMAKRGIDYVGTVYPGVGHGYFSALNLGPGNPAFDEACDSWTKTLAFYREYLP